MLEGGGYGYLLTIEWSCTAAGLVARPAVAGRFPQDVQRLAEVDLGIGIEADDPAELWLALTMHRPRPADRMRRRRVRHVAADNHRREPACLLELRLFFLAASRSLQAVIQV